MVKCDESCIPCCDFCKYAVHETFFDEELGGDIYGGPIHCELHPDEKHDAICESCGFCDDFHCFRATMENSFIPGYDSKEEKEEDIPEENIEKSRARAVRRKKDFTKAIRKKKMWPEYYKDLHQYSKNKIHCSCPLCATKTRGKITTKQGAGENWSIKDKKRIEEMKEQEKEE
jgi:hypothetical protein